MSDFNNFGKLMHLPLADIEPGKKLSEVDFIITAAAEAVKEADGRNWVPVIVKETGDYQYQVVSNHFVYTVAKKAGLERVWCIVIASDNKSIEQAQILAQETIPKINLSTASRDSILSALQYLIDKSGNVLKGVDAIGAANKIASADREEWSSFNPITTLKCGISKGKKLDTLAEVFYLSAPTKEEIPLPQPPEAINIKRASRNEIFERINYLSTYKIDGFQSVDPDKATDIIFTESKSKWKSLNPISKLECGIDTAKIKTLKTVFSV